MFVQALVIDLEGLIANADEIANDWRDAWQADDPVGANTFVGEVTGLISEIKPAAEILDTLVGEARMLLQSQTNYSLT